MTDRSAYELNQEEISLHTATTAAGLSEAAQTILERRGLDLEMLARLGWRSSKKTTASSEFIEIPYWKDGKEVNCKTRSISGEKRFYQVQGGEKIFYNIDAIGYAQTEHRPLVICEGEMDCVAALQAGFLAVSVPDGAPARQIENEQSSKYDYLEGFPKDLEVIICADGDAAGANLLHDLGARFGRHRCKWIHYPDGCKDLNDILLKHGVGAVKSAIEAATWLKVDGIYKMRDLPPIPSPLGHRLDVIPITIRKGDFSVWTGVPSHGKTSFMNYVCFVLAQTGWNICNASFEQKPQTQHRYALRTMFNQKAARLQSDDELRKADAFIDQKYVFMVPNVDSDDDVDLGWVLDKMAASVYRYGTDMFVIDPWNEMDHNYPRSSMSQTEYTGFAVKQLKKFASRHQVHVAVIAHPAKMQRNRDGKYPMPTLYDIADSAHWFNKPDLGVIVHRSEGGNIIKVQKSRYHNDIGEPDEYPVEFDKETFRFTKPLAGYSAID
jgi:twinkle protein